MQKVMFQQIVRALLSTFQRKIVGPGRPQPSIGPVMIALWLMAIVPASARVEIEGPLEAVQLTAENASVGEVLSALADRFNINYSPRPDLDRAVEGDYAGSLQQVLGRILDGYNYVAIFSSNGVELKLWGRSNPVVYSRPSAPPEPSVMPARMPPPPPPPPSYNQISANTRAP
jgi:hypothetical protein